MAQTFSRLLVHVVFSTKDRTASLKADIRNDLFAYIGGVPLRSTLGYDPAPLRGFRPLADRGILTNNN